MPLKTVSSILKHGTFDSSIAGPPHYIGDITNLNKHEYCNVEVFGEVQMVKHNYQFLFITLLIRLAMNAVVRLMALLG